MRQKDVATLLTKLVIVAAGHIGLVLLLVRLLRRNRPAAFDVGCVVLVVPAAIAVAIYTYIVHPYVVKELPNAPPVLASVALAVVPAIVSFAVSLFVIVSMYGS
jgi:hypothetical protein